MLPKANSTDVRAAQSLDAGPSRRRDRRGSDESSPGASCTEPRREQHAPAALTPVDALPDAGRERGESPRSSTHPLR